MTTIIYTDGGCLGNPGPGGWACILIAEERVIKRSGAVKGTTNNRMELTAVIEALKVYGKEGIDAKAIILHTDSQYVQKGISEWIQGWIRKGWKTSTGRMVKNRDLWQELKNLSDSLPITWKWVRGHAGDPFNEMCDGLVKTAMKAIADGK